MKREPFLVVCQQLEVRWPFPNKELEADWRREFWAVASKLDEATTRRVVADFIGEPKRGAARPSPRQIAARVGEESRYAIAYKPPPPVSAETRREVQDHVNRWRASRGLFSKKKPPLGQREPGEEG